MRRFRWLHISDLRFAGSEVLEPLRPHLGSADLPELKRAFLSDLARLHKRCGPWDLVILAGHLFAVQSIAADDTSASSSPYAYQRVGEWIDELWPQLYRLGSRRPSLLLVPGRLDDPQQFGFLQNGSLPPRLTSRPQCGRDPRDFRASLEVDGLRIGVVGLTWLSPDERQLREMLDGDPGGWACEQDLRILITGDHQWRSVHGDFFPPSYQEARFDLHLCSGHVTTSQLYWRSDDLQTLVVPGRSLAYACAPKESKLTGGYIAGEITVAEHARAVRLWPRQGGRKGFFNNVTFEAVNPLAYGVPFEQLADEGTAPLPMAPSAPAASLDLLTVVIQALGLTRCGDAQDGAVAARLPELALALPQRETTLALLDETQDEVAAAELAERLLASVPPGGPPPLIVYQGAARPALHGALLLDERDVASVRDAKVPRRELARLLWQRASLERLSPYRSYGVVTEAGMFYGRTTELQEITATLGGHALLLVGPRRVGKSSLLSRAYAQLRAAGCRAVYLVIRQTFASPLELIEELIFKAKLDCPVPVDSGQDYRQQAAALTRFIRKHLAGATLLLDEADVFLYRDRQHGGAVAEELRALVLEGTCGVVLAGYGTLYQATLAQSEVVYNLGKVIFLGPLASAPAHALATAPMERIGCGWQDPALTAQVTAAVGAYPHLIQEACGRLLLRLRGARSPLINQEDVTEVLGRWKAETESSTLREMLIESIEVNLSGPAQAAVWLLAAEGEGFGLADVSTALQRAGFPEVQDRQALDIAHALRICGVCQRQGDRYSFVIPLLREAVRELDIPYRLGLLVERWRSLAAEERERFDFWGGNGSRKY